MKTKNIFLISALSLSGLYFIFLLLSLFGVFKISSTLAPSFNYLWAFIIIILCLGLYTLSLFVENKRKLIVPTWLSCSFYVSFFIFTNVYYLFNLYANFYMSLLFYLCLGVLISVLSLSLYFNCLKGDEGTLKNKLSFTGFVLFAISISITVLFELVVMFIKYIENTSVNLTGHTLASFGILILCATIFAVAFNNSIATNKKFANACLIKIAKVEKTAK